MSTATPGPNDAARAIRALEAEFQRLANANDAAAMTEAFYTDDAILLPPNAPQQNGKAAIRDFWKAFLAQGVTGRDSRDRQRLFVRRPGLRRRQIWIHRRRSPGRWASTSWFTNGKPTALTAP